MAETTESSERDKIAFEDADALLAVCGTSNKRLKLIERQLGIKLHVRGNEITIEGDEANIELARDVLAQLYGFAVRGRALDSDDMVRAVKVLQADRSARLREIFSDTIFVPKKGRPITPKGLVQKSYVDNVRDNDVVFAVGPAGTGKTFLAIALAVRALIDKEVKRIVLTRPAVEAGERLGFLPGTLEEKISPYLRPVYDALFDMLDFERARRLMEQEVIEVAPLAFMRGRTLNDSFVILDEAQNTTGEQMRMFLTRLGFGSKAVVTGDITQSDLPRGQSSGLDQATQILSGIKGISITRFSDADVVRHPLVQDIIRAYERYDARRQSVSEAQPAPDDGE